MGSTISGCYRTAPHRTAPTPKHTPKYTPTPTSTPTPTPKHTPTPTTATTPTPKPTPHCTSTSTLHAVNSIIKIYFHFTLRVSHVIKN